MLPILLIVAAVFALLFFVRVGGSQRVELMRRWPAVAFAGAAIVAASRGAIWPAIAFAALAALAWTWWPRIAPRLRPEVPKTTAPNPADAEARVILGVGPTATSSEIRAAYRTKMARAHPDTGGSNAEAARLTAARDRLLRKR
ncbi:DnaJ domain-containing protein [Terricaulis silvestris]|uniref:DnaJ domain protein n=1 Tax=Terricaulis silvestris TaxID=2686094 RepID=A0A6I6MTX2_9CAUL|nr:DnaJ domain-containing protein [Terricaulis silvestris]QGZ94613.1 DnaJ domain protein [Terricaulis silvestris]